MSRRRSLCPLLRGKTGKAAIDTCLNCPVPSGCGITQAAEQVKVKRATELVASGLSTASVASKMGVSRRTVGRWLRVRADATEPIPWEEVRRQYQECFPRA